MGAIATQLGDGFAFAGEVECPATGGSILDVGSLAPNFCLPDADMESFELQQALLEGFVVLHFYLHDAMPSSLRQAIGFSDHEEDFARCGARVVGISLDDCLRHAEFRDEHGLALQLLSDEDGEVCRLYQVWQERLDDGLARPAVHRATFVIDPDGVVVHTDHHVDARNHAITVLEHLRLFSGRRNGNRKELRRHA